MALVTAAFQVAVDISNNVNTHLMFLPPFVSDQVRLALIMHTAMYFVGWKSLIQLSELQLVAELLFAFPQGNHIIATWLLAASAS
jgi:hypothetical protein